MPDRHASRTETVVIGSAVSLVLTGSLGVLLAARGHFSAATSLGLLAMGLLVTFLTVTRLPSIEGAQGRSVVLLWGAVIGVTGVHILRAGEELFMRRDAAVYLNKARWVAGTGTIRDRIEPAAFAGVTMPGFGDQNRNVVDTGSGELAFEFLNGHSVLLATVLPLGARPVFVLSAVIAMFAIVAAHSLAIRAGASAVTTLMLMLALSLSGPFVYVARSTYSEPFQALTVLAGLLLVLWVFAQPGRRDHLRLVAGASLVASSQIFRVDGLLYTAIILGALALAVLVRGRALPLVARVAVLVGVFGSSAIGMFDLLVIASDYGARLRGQWLPLLLGAAASAALFLMVTGPLGVSFADRIFGWRRWQVIAKRASVSIASVWAGVLLSVQLSPLESIFFWFGPALIIAAGVGLHVLLRQSLLARDPAPMLLASFLALSIPLYILRPSIWADQPWASRRLMGVAAFALFVLAAVGITALLRGGLTRRGPRSSRVIGAALLAAVMVWTLHPLGTVRHHQPWSGEAELLEAICAGVSGADVVAVVGYPYAAFPIRAACQVPVTVLEADPEALERFLVETRAAERRLGVVTTAGNAATLRILIGPDGEGVILQASVGPMLRTIDDPTRRVAGRYPLTLEQHALFVAVD